MKISIPTLWRAVALGVIVVVWAGCAGIQTRPDAAAESASTQEQGPSLDDLRGYLLPKSESPNQHP